MKKILYAAALAGIAFLSPSAHAQLLDEQNVNITMDLQPILQLNMTTPDQVDFTFDNIGAYFGGITKYGATILTVSSTVDWDLYAVGTSNQGTFWDLQVKYGPTTDPNAIANIPLEALELHQNQANVNNAGGTGVIADYSAAFAAVTPPYPLGTFGQNNVYASNAPYVLPPLTAKFIQGGNLVGDFAAGGSYLTQGAVLTSIYRYVIDYRLVPGLPAIFPTAGTNIVAAAANDIVTVNGAGTYAQPGFYTMNVKYVLLENQ